MKKVLALFFVGCMALSMSSCVILHKEGGDNGKHKGEKKEHHDNGKHKGQKK